MTRSPRHRLPEAAIYMLCPNSKTRTGRHSRVQAEVEAAVGAKERLNSTTVNLVHSAWNGMNLRHKLASFSPSLRAAFLVNAVGLMKKYTKCLTGSLLKMAVHKTMKKTTKLSRLKPAILLQPMLVVLLPQLLCRKPDHS